MKNQDPIQEDNHYDPYRGHKPASHGGMIGLTREMTRVITSLQCYSVLSNILVKNELSIPLERVSNVLSTGKGFICLSPPVKLKIAVLFCSIYRKTISFSAIVF